jgi:hypothetical protein
MLPQISSHEFHQESSDSKRFFQIRHFTGATFSSDFWFSLGLVLGTGSKSRVIDKQV